MYGVNLRGWPGRYNMYNIYSMSGNRLMGIAINGLCTVNNLNLNILAYHRNVELISPYTGQPMKLKVLNFMGNSQICEL